MSKNGKKWNYCLRTWNFLKSCTIFVWQCLLCQRTENSIKYFPLKLACCLEGTLQNFVYTSHLSRLEVSKVLNSSFLLLSLLELCHLYFPLDYVFWNHQRYLMVRLTSCSFRTKNYTSTWVNFKSSGYLIARFLIKLQGYAITYPQ